MLSSLVLSLLIPSVDISTCRSALDEASRSYPHIRTLVNPKATLVLQASDLHRFGLTTIAANGTDARESKSSFDRLLFAQRTSEGSWESAAQLPPETGRALLISNPRAGEFNQFLVKGTGSNQEHIPNNQLRDSSMGFSGTLELSEAVRDFYYSRVLEESGVLIAPPVAITAHNEVGDFQGHREWTANYARAFRYQTRVSNLAGLSPQQRKLEVDAAIAAINEFKPGDPIISYAEYFEYMMDLAAKHAAIYHAIGYTQDSLHYGQMTLAGEMLDLGIGQFGRPETQDTNNALHPQYRFENQALQFWNMLHLTHDVRLAEGESRRFSNDERGIQSRPSLLGFIASFAPEVATDVLLTRPEERFWQKFDDYYDRYDPTKATEVIRKMRAEFQWQPDIANGQLQTISIPAMRYLDEFYDRRLREFEASYENQDLTWQNEGVPRVIREAIFGSVIGEPPSRPIARLESPPQIPIFSDRSVPKQDAWAARPDDLKPVMSLEDLEKKWPLSVKLKTLLAESGQVQSLLLVSSDGLDSSQKKELESDLMKSLSGHAGILTSHQSDPHTMLQWGAHYYHIWRLEDADPRYLSRHGFRLASGVRMDAYFPLTRTEGQRLSQYVSNIRTDFSGTLGIDPIESEGTEADHSVYSFQTNGGLRDNRLLCGSFHNCLSWITTAPIQANGDAFFQALGIDQIDIQNEIHSYPMAFSDFVLSGRSERRPLLFVQSTASLSRMNELYDSHDDLERLLHLEPHADDTGAASSSEPTASETELVIGGSE